MEADGRACFFFWFQPPPATPTFKGILRERVLMYDLELSTLIL